MVPGAGGDGQTLTELSFPGPWPLSLALRPHSLSGGPHPLSGF